MSFLSHTKTDKNLLVLTLSVCLMFFTAVTLTMSAYYMESRAVINFILFIIEWMLDSTLRLLGFGVAALALAGIAWILDVYFTKLQSHMIDSKVIRIILVSYFITSVVFAYWIGQQQPIGYGWLFIISTLLMIGAYVTFQRAMNRDP